MTPLPYLLYPPKVEAQAPYPLIIFLHGIGERGDNLELVKKYGLPHYLETGEITLPAYVAAPQCPADMRWEDVLDALDSLLDGLLAMYPLDSLDSDRILLTGFSMGGFGTWRWALRRPERFAAIMPVGGSGFKRDRFPENTSLSTLKALPIWIVHGAQDASVPVSGADEFAALFSALGANFGYTRYPDATHGQTSDRAFHDRTILNWLLAQKRESK